MASSAKKPNTLTSATSSTRQISNKSKKSRIAYKTSTRPSCWFRQRRSIKHKSTTSEYCDLCEFLGRRCTNITFTGNQSRLQMDIHTQQEQRAVQWHTNRPCQSCNWWPTSWTTASCISEDTWSFLNSSCSMRQKRQKHTEANEIHWRYDVYGEHLVLF